MDFRLLEAIPQFEQDGVTRRLSSITITHRQPRRVVSARPWPQFPAEVLATAPQGLRAWYILTEFGGTAAMEAEVCAALDALHRYVEVGWEALQARRRNDAPKGGGCGLQTGTSLSRLRLRRTRSSSFGRRGSHESGSIAQGAWCQSLLAMGFDGVQPLHKRRRSRGGLRAELGSTAGSMSIRWWGKNWHHLLHADEHHPLSLGLVLSACR